MFNFSRLFFVILFFFSIQIQAQNDCTDAIVVCGNTGFQGLSAVGVGTQELSANNTCDSEENNSIWLKLPIRTSGTLAFTLTPESTDINEDFDFFIFGPNVTCANLGQAIRCSTTNPLLSNQADNLTGMSNTETDTSEGPGELGNSFIQSLNVIAGEYYYIVIDRPLGESNFSLNWSSTATFETLPSIVAQPLKLKECAVGNSAIFNFNPNSNLITGGQSGTLLTYHLNSNDAITGDNPIIGQTQFQNTSNPQTIYARLTNTASGCFVNTQFEIEVYNGATVLLDNYTICDDGSDGNGTNAQTAINLNNVTQTIMGGQSLTGLTINYFATSSAATTNMSPLPINFYNTTPTLQNIYVRILSPTGCVITKQIHIKVMPQPAVFTVTLTQCDVELNPDGITLFNLNDAIPALTAGNPNLSVQFFENGNTIPLVSPYTNLVNHQLLNAQITNTTSGCTSTSFVRLIANVSPPPVFTIAPECDIVGIESGIVHFDLNDANITLSPTQTATFYTNPNDALLQQNASSNISDYVNIVAYNDIVFVRIDDAGLCASISPLTLTVNKLPKITLNQSGLYICETNPSYFITLSTTILEGNQSEFTYEWFKDGQPLGLTTSQISVNTAGNYAVEVTRNGCTITQTIVVLPSTPAEIEDIIVADLITDSNTVTIQVSASSLGNYTYAINNINGPYQESNTFYNVAPGIHEFYINDLNACGIFGPIQVNVLGVPKYFTPNGDGYNDTWNIVGVDAKHKNAIIYIFNRQGKLLKQVTPLGKGWDGTFDDKQVPAEDYWYTIFLEDNRSAKGHFSLKR